MQFSPCAAAVVCLAGADKQGTDGQGRRHGSAAGCAGSACATARTPSPCASPPSPPPSAAASPGSAASARARASRSPPPDDPFNERHGKKPKNDEYATRERTAWLVSTACDIVATKEKLGVVVSSPFLLYLVPSRKKAVQLRSICKPIRSLGIHSVSLHSGASIEHQMSGLRVVNRSFLVSTPERLLELMSLKTIDISSVSMLVIYGLKCFMDLNISNKLCSIRDAMLSNLRRITKLSINDSVTLRSAFIEQYVNFCPSDTQDTKGQGRF